MEPAARRQAERRQTEKRQAERATGKNEAAYFLALNVLTKASTYALLLAFANLFSLPSYGEVAFTMTILALLPYALHPGTQTLLVPLLVKKRDTASLFWFFLGTTSLAAIAGALAFRNADWLMPLLALIPIGFVFMFFRAALRARHAYHWIQASDALLQFLYLALVFALRSLDKLGLTLAYAAAYACATLFVVWIARSTLRGLRFQLRFPTVKAYAAKGFAASALLLSIDVLGRSDSFLLGLFSSFSEVARYNVAFTLSDVILVIPLSISMFLLTRSAELDKTASDKAKSKAVLLRCARLSFSLSLFSAIVLCALAQPLLAIAFKKYADAGALVLLIAASLLFYSVYVLKFTYESGRMHPEKIVAPFAAAAGAKIALDLVLVPPFGALGMAAATLAVGAALFFATRTFSLKQTAAAVVAAPALLAAAFFTGVWGLAALLPAAAFAFKAGLLEKTDLEAVAVVLRQTLAQTTKRAIRA